jgi:hypothetical protein
VFSIDTPLIFPRGDLIMAKSSREKELRIWFVLIHELVIVVEVILEASREG